ncbi:MAG: 16S rRNA (adenine(1518)-N(6)/adenine(1519)-N(6))-dimethyltransferase RsmA [Chloroflexota bacterium]
MGRDYRQGDSLWQQTQDMLRRYHLRARKGLGQHFLVDDGVLQLILTAAGLEPADVVLEVGPGLGLLTRELARRAGRVVAVELDRRLAGILELTLAPLGNVSIVNEDILEIEPEALLREPTAGHPPEYKVVANLPYYITSAVLRHFLEASLRPRTMVVMVQREVGEVIAAAPGKMSLLSVSVQLYGRPEIIGPVPAASFYPPPEVDSVLLRVDLYPQPAVAVSDVAGFFKVVRAGFRAPRKQLANSLAQGVGRPRTEVSAWLEQAGIEPRRRPQTLSLEEWARLWRVIYQARRGG